MKSAAKKNPALIPAPAEVKPVAAAKVETPAAPAKAAVEVVSERRALAYRHIMRSPHNPRTDLDAPEAQASIAELANSIAELGLLEPLVVREAEGTKAVAPEAVILVAGERRYRAIGWLIKTGRATDDFKVEVTVRKLTELERLLAAVAENVARKDLSPLDEANAFKKLRDAHKLGTDEIARRVGKTQRYVQQRLALVEKLDPVAQEALHVGKITFSEARALTLGNTRQQKEIVREIEKAEAGQAERPDHNDIRNALTRRMIPASYAIFDRGLYTAEIAREDDEAPEYFTDEKLFWKLQRAAVEAKAQELKAAGVKHKVYDESQHTEFFYAYKWQNCKKDDPAGATIIRLGASGQVEILEHMVLKPEERHVSNEREKTAKENAKPKKAAPGEAFQNSARVHAHVRKTFALQRAVMADPAAALRILCATLLAEHRFDPINIAREENDFGMHGAGGFKDYDGDRSAPELNGLLAKLLDGCPAVKAKTGYQVAGDKDAVKVWKWLEKKPLAFLEKLTSALVADQVGTWCNINTGDGLNIGDDETAVAIAEHLKIAGKEAKHGLALEFGDLESLRKPALLAIARELDCLAYFDAKKGEGCDGPGYVNENMPATAIREAIAKKLKAGAGKDVVLPTLTFADDKEMHRRVAAFVKE